MKERKGGVPEASSDYRLFGQHHHHGDFQLRIEAVLALL